VLAERVEPPHAAAQRASDLCRLTSLRLNTDVIASAAAISEVAGLVETVFRPR
jgi:hypothetical protein